MAKLKGEAKLGAHTLCFDVNAMIALEDAGLDADEINRQFAEKPTLRLLRTLFFHGLQKHHPGTSEAETGEIMSELEESEIVAVLDGALGASQLQEGDLPPDPMTPAETPAKETKRGRKPATAG